MKYRTLEEIAPEARVVPLHPEPRRALRRKRLERLAAVLEAHTGPLRLFSRAEYLPRDDRMLLRQDDSPLDLAFRDPVLRGEGLAGDRMRDALAFFDLSWNQAHHLFCDCHYEGRATSKMVAGQVRSLAHRVTLGDLWDRLRASLKQRAA